MIRNRFYPICSYSNAFCMNSYKYHSLYNNALLYMPRGNWFIFYINCNAFRVTRVFNNISLNFHRCTSLNVHSIAYRHIMYFENDTCIAKICIFFTKGWACSTLNWRLSTNESCLELTLLLSVVSKGLSLRGRALVVFWSFIKHDPNLHIVVHRNTFRQATFKLVLNSTGFEGNAETE